MQVTYWSRQHNLMGDPPADGTPPRQLAVSLRRLRLTFNEQTSEAVETRKALLGV
jgi:hypothetical protein